MGSVRSSPVSRACPSRSFAVFWAPRVAKMPAQGPEEDRRTFFALAIRGKVFQQHDASPSRSASRQVRTDSGNVGGENPVSVSSVSGRPVERARSTAFSSSALSLHRSGRSSPLARPFLDPATGWSAELSHKVGTRTRRHNTASPSGPASRQSERAQSTA